MISIVNIYSVIPVVIFIGQIQRTTCLPVLGWLLVYNDKYIAMDSIKKHLRSFVTSLSWREYLLFATFITGVLLFFWTAYLSRRGLYNPDGLSYIVIAQQYIAGNFDIAVNAYWSPLISWLMVPFLQLSIEGRLAFMLVNAAAASATLLVGMWLVWRHTEKSFISALLFAVTATPLLMYAIAQFTPDLLVVAWVVFFIAALIKADSLANSFSLRGDVKTGVLLGLVGALGYFAKLFVVPVLVVSLIAWTLVRLVAHKKRIKQKELVLSVLRLLRAPALALTVVAITIAPWAIILSSKYDSFTIGSSFSVNMRSKFGGEQKTQVTVAPADAVLLVPQDPTLALSSGSGGQEEGSSGKGIKHYINERLKVLPFYLNRIASIAPYIMLIILALAVAFLFGKVNYKDHKPMLLTGLVFAVYFAGFAAITETKSGGGNIRYYWPMFLAAVIIACLALPRLWNSIKKQVLWRKVVFCMVVLLLPAIPYVQYVEGFAYPFSITIGSDGTLREPKWAPMLSVVRQPQGPAIMKVGEAIDEKNLIQPNDRIASNINREARYITYTTEAEGYAPMRARGFSLEGDSAILKKYKIDYFIEFTPSHAVGSTAPEGAVATFTYAKLPCQNDRWVVPQPCTVQVIKLR